MLKAKYNVRALTSVVLYYYIAIDVHCSWELKKYIYYFIKFLSPLLLKKYFLFLSFSLSLSLRLLFFLPLSFSFFFSLIYCMLCRSILDLHHCWSSSSSPTLPSHATDPYRPILHLTAHPTLTSLVLHLTADPSSIADLSFIIDPSSIGTAFIELKSAADFVVGFHGCGWILWVSLGFVMVVWLGFMVAEFHGSVVNIQIAYKTL